MADFEILFHIPTLEVSYGLLCLFLVPVQGNNGQVMLDLRDLTTIVQDPHAHCTNCENHYIMEHAKSRLLCPFFCPFGNLNLRKILHRHLSGLMASQACSVIHDLQFCVTHLGFCLNVDCGCKSGVNQNLQ
jgi:hypothetical protein